jgi:predicted nucleic-acid-binding protein
MNKIVIDTNTLISFVTDRNLKQQKMAADLFENASQLKSLVFCPQNVLTEFVYVMDKVYQVSVDKTQEILRDFLSMTGIKIMHDLNIEQLLFYWPKYFNDFGDAIVASVCREIKGSTVATFDRKFINALKKVNLEIHSFKEQ